MGSSVSLQVEFDRDPPLYYGGELLKGTVRVTPVDSKFRGKELSLKIEGQILAKALMKHTTFLGDRCVPHTFFQECIILAEPPSGEKDFLVCKGQNTWSFEIKLPTDVPPTFPAPYGHFLAISYTVEANFKKSFFGITDRKNIIFRPPVLIPTRPTDPWSKINRQNIQVKIHLPQGIVYSPGAMINGTIEIDNPKRIRIKRIECRVEQTLQLGNDSHTVNTVEIYLPKITDINESNRIESFEIQLPQDLPPSYDRPLNVQPNHIAVVVSYALSFMVRVIGILSDFKIAKPILIGMNLKKHQDNDEIVLIDVKSPKRLPPISTQQDSKEVQSTVSSTLKQEDKITLNPEL